MIYKSISIENLKGINKVKIDFTNNRILTLVGLNESGKTTILEGMHLFYRLIKGEKFRDSDYNNIRPKGIAFSGSISIIGALQFESEDIKKMESHLKKEGKISKLNFPGNFEYEFRFNYELHKYIDTSTYVTFNAKSKAAKDTLFTSNRPLWQTLVNFIKKELIPDILYYEDFIFQIPDEIPFSFEQKEKEDDEWEEEDEYAEWKLVLDDILKSISPKFTSFQEHVVDIWHSDNDTARQRIYAMEMKLDSVITVAWQELFESSDPTKTTKRLNFKEIKIVCSANEDGFNISFKIKSESGKAFSINERSKGFKWFFSFLIFTEFRKNRTRNILFLLDEPASNLHSSAQLKILNGIEQLSDKSMVVYSTHSHHLINPIWLNGAYVVINEAISSENLEGALTDTDAKITLDKYYNFVNSSTDSSQNIFFQPILDRLDYKISSLELSLNITICEGKFDWYTFKYLSEVIFEDNFNFNFYPGAGKDHLQDIIRLYLSWGSSFVVVLDGDKPSQKAKEKYVKEFPEFVEESIFTYKDIINEECTTEALFLDDDIKKICDSAFGEGTYDSVSAKKKELKSKFNFSLIRLLVGKKKVELSKDVRDKFKRIFEFIKEKNPEANKK